jgi:RNA polymerase sigma factor (sigma-70 family)
MGQEPFEAIVAAHHAEIYRYLRRVTFRASDAEDLSQEAFLRAFRAYRALPPEANVRAWLFAIATNLFRNHIRGEQRRQAAHAVVKGRSRGDEGEGPEGAALFNEAHAVMTAVVDKLPLRQRLAFVMRKIHDLSYDEIARGLGCSEDSARAHVFQAFRKIRQGLEGHALPQGESPS